MAYALVDDLDPLSSHTVKDGDISVADRLALIKIGVLFRLELIEKDG